MADDDEYSTIDYWNKKYQKPSEYDWILPYEKLKPYLGGILNQQQKILVTGCGNSTMSSKMYEDGFKNIVNIDFSDVVIQQMKDRYKKLDMMEWQIMDVRKMSFADDEFDITLDKCTIDALACFENPDETIQEALNEYSRVTKPNGKILIISFGQIPDRVPLFNPETRCSWKYEGFIRLPFEIAPQSYYYIYILSKSCDC